MRTSGHLSLLALICITVFSGCTSAPRTIHQASILGEADVTSFWNGKGELLGSLVLKRTVFRAQPKSGDYGFSIYVDRNAPGVNGPMVCVFRIEAGTPIEVVYDTQRSKRFMQSLAAIHFEPFDFTKEVKIAEDRAMEEAKSRGTHFYPPTCMDGAEYQITITTADGAFSVSEWNPSDVIDVYAAYSEKIQKLKQVLDLFAEYYGRTKFGV